MARSLLSRIICWRSTSEGVPPWIYENREDDFDLLFEAVVQPLVGSERNARRIDGVITNALGGAADYFKKGVPLRAFRGRDETALRGAVGTEAAVIIEGVNLAAANARKDADALVSKLMRIQEAGAQLPMRILIGYVTSPGGLNGETDMRDWIKAKITNEVFDVVHDSEAFRIVALNALRESGLRSR